ncbi:hypothetical protein [Marinobacter confluentis]|uniref:DUF839 domain-containing protein n=1 Tax=Marinobacter confluentis TaxID=1697557 RepID=A0A4Z1BI51_9GAMM|nr:hypothetical protein [Marinobacter confluentis]TGN39209.1 hypothetical protein E5Q11_11185 [Marinobacter confluentis]
MISKAKIAGLFILVLAGASIGGCGGGSGGGDSGGDSSSGSDIELPPLFGLPQLSGLDGDAGNQDILYFSGSYEEGGSTVSSLYGLSPANPGSVFQQHLNTVEQDNPRTPQELAEALYRPLYESEIDPDDKSVLGYRVSDVVFGHNREAGNATSEGFARASTDGLLSDQKGERVSSESYANVPDLNDGNPVLWENYVDADQAEISYGRGSSIARVRMNYAADDFARFFPNTIIKNIVPFFNVGSDQDRHNYLALRSDESTQCGGYFVTRASASTGSSGSFVDNSLPDGLEAIDAVAVGEPLADGTRYLVINVRNQADCTAEATLWRFVPSDPYATALTQVLNDDDEPIVFPTAIGGVPYVPQDRHLARQGNVLYFGVTFPMDDGPQLLYRIEDGNWTSFPGLEQNLGYETGFLIADGTRVAASVGNEVVSWDLEGNDRQILDESPLGLFEYGITSEVLGSRDGWIFYNRENNEGQITAVAMKVDGSDSLEISDAQWSGASGTGSGESIGQVTELSEVFFWRGEDIGAVSAADPAAGLVLLGKLDSVPDDVVMYGLAPGPHRLVQVFPAGQDDGRVYYLNTRNTNSLRALAVGSPIGHQRPVDGF